MNGQTCSFYQCLAITLFCGVEGVLVRDPLDLGGEPRVGEDGAVRVDAVDGEPESDLLVAVRHVEEAACDNFSHKLHIHMYWQNIFVLHHWQKSQVRRFLLMLYS